MNASDREKIAELLACAAFQALTQEVLHKGNHLKVRASGHSMYPFIQDGDILHVEPCRASQLNVGDVVFFCDSQGKYITHRLVKKKVEKGQVVLVTKGDHLTYCDGKVTPEEVIGRVVIVDRNGREIRLDRGLRRVLDRVWGRLSPQSWWLRPVLRRGWHLWRRFLPERMRPV